MLAISLFVLVALLAVLSSAEFLADLSFDAPYTEVDATGERVIGKGWRTAGSAIVNSNFIRLTPDRQSKKGSIWSKKALMTPSFNAVMKFRISGQGKNMFGDGIALWIVQQSYYMEGNLHGFQDKFVGIGIIFDTFKNTETLHLHKDVTVLVNNGEKTFEAMTETPQGCDVDFRYHAARADFNIDSKSAVKIVVDGTSISVLMDARGEGQYSQCVTINNHGLSADWLMKSHIGITATTGQLADNHDILSFSSYSDEKVMDATESQKENSLVYEPKPGSSHEARIADLENAMNQVMTNNEYLDHHVEHEFSGIQDHIDNLQAKLKASAASGDGKSSTGGANLVVMEPIIKKELDSSIGSRLNKLENDLKSLIERKTRELDGKVDKKIREIAGGNFNSIKADSSDSLISEGGANTAPLDNEPCPDCPSCSRWPMIVTTIVNVAIIAGYFFKFNKKGRYD